METGEIIQIFAESGFQIDPQALDAMRTSSQSKYNILSRQWIVQFSLWGLSIYILLYRIHCKNTYLCHLPNEIPIKKDRYANKEQNMWKVLSQYLKILQTSPPASGNIPNLCNISGTATVPWVKSFEKDLAQDPSRALKREILIQGSLCL